MEMPPDESGHAMLTNDDIRNLEIEVVTLGNLQTLTVMWKLLLYCVA